MSNQLDKSVLCCFPWVGAFIDPERNVIPCCHIRDQNQTRFANTIDEQLNSSLYAKTRRLMLSGIKPSWCSGCYDTEAAGGKSARNTSFEFESGCDFDADKDWKVQNNVQFIEVRCSNVCQNSCRHCGAESSSVIAKEAVIHFGSTKPVLRYSGQTPEWSVDAVLSCSNSLKRLWFSGGEPMVQWQHYEILKGLIAQGKTDVQLRYSSNSGALNLGKDNVLDLWKHFKDVTYFTSIDADDPVMQYWRRPSKFESIIETVQQIRDFAPHVNIWNNTALSWPTVETAFSAVAKLHAIGINTGFTMVTNPKCFSLRNLPDFKKDEIRALVESQPDYIPRDFIISFMDQDPSANINIDFAHQLRLDEIRGEDFFNVFPEHEDMRRYLL